MYDNATIWKRLPHSGPLHMGIHRSPVNSPQNRAIIGGGGGGFGQLLFNLSNKQSNCWYLRRCHVTVIWSIVFCSNDGTLKLDETVSVGRIQSNKNSIVASLNFIFGNGSDIADLSSHHIFEVQLNHNCSDVTVVTANIELKSFPDSKVRWPNMGPSGADRTQVGPMLASLTLLSGLGSISPAPISARTRALHAEFDALSKWFIYHDFTMKSMWANAIH